MKKFRILLSYYLRGFRLMNKSLELYIISLLFLLVLDRLALLNLRQGSISWLIMFIFQICFLLVYFGFSVSIPVFFKSKLEGKKIGWREVTGVVLRNTKRIILPGIVLGVLLIAVLLLILFFVSIVLRLDSPDRSPLFFVGVNAISSLFLFTSMFFSLEGRGLLFSVKQSLVFSIKNIWFVAIAFCLTTVVYLLAHDLYSSANFLIKTLVIGVREYVVICVSASAVLYYLDFRGKFKMR